MLRTVTYASKKAVFVPCYNVCFSARTTYFIQNLLLCEMLSFTVAVRCQRAPVLMKKVDDVS